MVRLVALLFITLIGLSAAAQVSRVADVKSSRSFIYHGKLVRPDGSTPTGSMSVTLKILSPDPKLCVLWSETQTVEMKEGGFSVELGHGVNRLPGASGGAAADFKQAFVNNPGLVISGAQCASGNSYTPSSSDDRLLSATFNDSGSVIEIAGLPIKSVPFALQAEELAGYGIANLAKISGAGSAVTYSPAEVQTLKDMLGGDVFFDMKARAVKNIANPTDPQDAATKAFVESHVAASMVGAGLGTVTNVSVVGGTPLSVTNGSSTPQLSITQANTTTAGYLSSADWNTFNNKQPAGAYLTSVPNLDTSKITTGTLPVARGGTGIAPTMGDANKVYGLDSGGLAGELKAITGGSGINIAHSAGTIQINATGGNVGTVTTVGVGGLPLSVTNATSSPTISIAQATTSAAGYLSAADWNTFNSKQPAGSYLTSISSGNVTTALGFTPLSQALAPNQVFIGNGSSVATAGFFGIGQMRNNVGTLQYPTACAASQTLTWSAVNDVLVCSNIDGLNADKITAGTITTARLGSGTADSSKYLRGDSTWQTLPAGADNLGNHIATQNLNLGAFQLVGNGGTSGLGIDSAGNVGIGTTSPAAHLDVNGTIRAHQLCDQNGNNCKVIGSGWAGGGGGGTVIVGMINSATWSPTDKHAQAVLSNGDLTVSAGTYGLNFPRVHATRATGTSGKYYYEIQTLNLGGGGNAIYAGFDYSTTAIGAGAPDLYSNYSIFDGSVAAGDIVMLAADVDAGKFWYGKNGVWHGSGNPATGANPASTFTAGTALIPAFSGAVASNNVNRSGGTANFGAASFVHALPAGFDDFRDITPITQMTDADANTKIELEQSANEDKIRFSTVGTERMVISNAGNVGIGTTSPGEKLEVVGGKIKSPEYCIGASCITAWPSVGGSGTVTNVGVGGLPLSVTNGTSTPTISIAQANTTTAGYLSAADWNTFNGKQAALGFTPVSDALSAGQVFLGNGSNVAAGSFFGIGQMRNNIGTLQMPTSCAASQTLTWSAVTDVLVCSNIDGLNADKITTGTVATARLGSGTANSTTFLRGDGTWATPAGTAAANKLVQAGDGYPAAVIGFPKAISCARDAARTAILKLAFYDSTAPGYVYYSAGATWPDTAYNRYLVTGAYDSQSGDNYTVGCSGNIISSTGVHVALGGGAGESLWSTGASSSVNYGAGNVGIGTTTPAAKLDVAGTIRPGSAGITTGGACTGEGSMAYDIAAHAPVYCNQSGVWASMAPAAGNNPKAWVKFVGTSCSPNCTISASSNVSTVTRNSTGNYTITFTTPLADGDYVVNIDVATGSSGVSAYNHAGAVDTSSVAPSASSFRIQTGLQWYSGSFVADEPIVYITVFR